MQSSDSIQEKGQQFKNQITTFTTLWSEYKASWQYRIYMCIYIFQKHRKWIKHVKQFKFYLDCHELICPRQTKRCEESPTPLTFGHRWQRAVSNTFVSFEQFDLILLEVITVQKVKHTYFYRNQAFKFLAVFLWKKSNKHPNSTSIQNQYFCVLPPKFHITIWDGGLFIALFS